MPRACQPSDPAATVTSDPCPGAKGIEEAFSAWIFRFAGGAMGKPRQESWKHPSAVIVWHAAVLLAGLILQANVSQLGSVR